ncbi:hypothetical protein HDV03_001570 [Kappamyces sp. JEL0829]|nr:hypothetical protein HDV03_001570 [Kappamyces sp. JEL0829]
MASMRDAHKRLDAIYKATASEAKEAAAENASLDEFTRLKKKVHQEMKSIREALRDRDASTKAGGTTTESAEASYRIRVMIKTVKESIARMQEIYDKEAKKKKPKDPKKVADHKEIMELCKGHLEEVEMLEKKKHNELHALDRNELLGANNGPSYLIDTKGRGDAPIDPFSSELPDIDAEEDLKNLRETDKMIDKDIEGLGTGVQRLRDIAIDMGQELDRQAEDLDRIDKNVEKVLDHVDNINVTMKKTVEGVWLPR